MWTDITTNITLHTQTPGQQHTHSYKYLKLPKNTLPPTNRFGTKQSIKPHRLSWLLIKGTIDNLKNFQWFLVFLDFFVLKISSPSRLSYKSLFMVFDLKNFFEWNFILNSNYKLSFSLAEILHDKTLFWEWPQKYISWTQNEICDANDKIFE